MRKTSLAFAAVAVIAAVATAPAVAANDSTQTAKPTQVKHATTLRHQHRAALQMRGTEVNGNVANANAQAEPAKEESMAAQAGKLSKSGYASDPNCKPGTLTQLDDSKMHPCQ